MYGGRGGLLLFRSIRVGADFTQQLAKRTEDGKKVGSKNTVFGVSLGLIFLKPPFRLLVLVILVQT